MAYSNKTLAQIVTELPSAASLLEKHDLDYCCRGKQTLKEACGTDAKLQTLEEQISILAKAHEDQSRHVDVNSLTNPELVDLILKKHHDYVKEIMPVISAHLHKVSSKHGGRHPELHEIYSIFEHVSQEMTAHMMKEEQILFPAIIELQRIADEGLLASSASGLEGPISVMEMEHETVGDLLAQIKQKTDKYTPPSDACMTYRLSFDELKEFEEDLHRHVHLENNILFPRVREIIQVNNVNH